jgi:hypothetical protein
VKEIKVALTASGFAGIFIALALTSAVLTAALATQLSARPAMMDSPVARTRTHVRSKSSSGRGWRRAKRGIYLEPRAARAKVPAFAGVLLVTGVYPV